MNDTISFALEIQDVSVEYIATYSTLTSDQWYALKRISDTSISTEQEAQQVIDLWKSTNLTY
jgi:hypothetical protein